MPNRTIAHQNLITRIFNAVASDPELCKNIMIFSRIVGGFHTKTSFVRVGQNGQADLYGYLKGGKGFEIEVKTGGAVRTKAQLNWAKACKNIGVKYFVIRENDVEISNRGFKKRI